MAPGSSPVAPTRPEPMPPPRGPAATRRRLGSIVVGLVLTAAIVVAVLTRDGADPPLGQTTTGQALPGSELVLGGSSVPADVEVANTTGLVDGSEVAVKVTAHEGVEVYGFEAFLCKAGATFELDAEVRPDDTGNCVSKPLSAGSDRYKQVKGEPPYTVTETTFRAGVGTDSYSMIDGTPVTITCGPGHPCQLVLKVQYPKGYGFRAFPLDYA